MYTDEYTGEELPVRPYVSPLPMPNHMLLIQLRRMKRTPGGQAILDAKIEELYERGILKKEGETNEQTQENRALCS